jgi:hypothetical protein
MSTINSWDVQAERRHDQFFAYADAYIRASIGACGRMAEIDLLQTWPDANVIIMMLAAHSAELFLKGVTLATSGGFKETHHLNFLLEDYEKAHPDEPYRFNCPFVITFEGMTVNQGVGGSSPTSGARHITGLRESVAPFSLCVPAWCPPKFSFARR